MSLWTSTRWLVALTAAAGLSACDNANMAAQPKAADWDHSDFFDDGSSMRHPVPGTQPRDEPNLPVPQPQTITEAMVKRGQQRFDIFCTPCHGRSGDGRGMIVQRGFPAPPPLWSDALLKAKASLFYDTITHGHGVMYPYADRVPPADRWAIAAYIRALQTSHGADPKILSLADRDSLDGKP